MSPPPFDDDVDVPLDEADDSAIDPGPAPAAPARPSGRPSAPRSPDAINADIEAMRKEHDVTGRWGDAEHAKMKALLDEQLTVQDAEQAPTPAASEGPPAGLTLADDPDAALPDGMAWDKPSLTTAEKVATAEGLGPEALAVKHAMAAAARAGDHYTAERGITELRATVGRIRADDILREAGEALDAASEEVPQLLNTLEARGLWTPDVLQALAKLGARAFDVDTPTGYARRLRAVEAAYADSTNERSST